MPIQRLDSLQPFNRRFMPASYFINP